MKWIPCAIMIMFISFQGIYSQVNDIPCQDVPSDTADGKPHIRGELSLTETLGGRISGSAFSGDEAFTATSCAVDFYLDGGLSFGPEAGVFVDGTVHPLLGLNVAYTHWHTGGKRGAYLRLGYGIIPPVEEHTATDTRSLLTAGLGMKFLISTKSLLRLEVNYKYQRWKENLPIYYLTSSQSGSEMPMPDNEPYKSKNSIGILIGFSAVLR